MYVNTGNAGPNVPTAVTPGEAIRVRSMYEYIIDLQVRAYAMAIVAAIVVITVNAFVLLRNIYGGGQK